MKKPLIYSLAAAALVASTAFTVAVSATNTSPNATSTEPTTLTAEAPLEAVPDAISTSSDETVYIITDATGAMTKSFVGSTLNTSSTPMPITLNITYTLDGHKISPAELAGKYGHVKITYDFTATSTAANGKLVPFLTITGLSLDSQKFSNIKITSGKIIKESTDSTLLAGYAMPGLDTDLGTDFLPSSFTVEADTTSFALDTVYTFATNELFADIDTSKLNSIDSLVDSVNQLSSALDQLITGSSTLANGLDSAYAGALELSTGATKLSSGAKDLAAGAASVNAGAESLAAGASKLSTGLGSVVNINNSIMAKVNSVTSAIQSRISELNAIITEVSTTDPELAAKLTELMTELTGYYDQAYAAVNSYVNGIQALSDGANELKSGADALAAGTATLSDGANTLADGADQLSTGADSLASGLSQLSSGSHTLHSGLTAFKQQGIDQLVNFANRDLSGFLSNLRTTVEAADSYHHYSNPHATSVKFIFKSPSL